MTVAVVYFAYLAILALTARLKPRPTESREPRPTEGPGPGPGGGRSHVVEPAVGRNFSSAGATVRPLRVLVVSLVALASILALGMPHVMPLVYLLTGYWLPAMLVRSPDRRFEQRLLRFDRRLLGAQGAESFARRMPRAVLEYFELAYLFCYAIVPLGFAWLVLAGFESEAAMFWSVVLLAAFACYGVLPWLPTRAPRAIEAAPPREPSLIKRLNLLVLSRASVQWNTFPSGHTAASVATALAVGIHLPLAGLVLGSIAVSIAIGSVAGRYHYAADAIAGALVAIAAFLTATAARAL